MARTITIEDLYQIKFVSRPRISADGQRVAFVVTTIDGNKHEYHSSIWVSPAAGGEARRFTSGPANTSSPVWSPNGRWLAFVSEREGETTAKDQKEQKKRGKGKGQIWIMPTDGGEARQLTFMEHGVGAPVWSPDSKYVLFSAQVGSTNEEDEDGKDGKRLPRARVIDRLWYRLDGVGFIYERRSHLFLIEAAGGEPQQLTDGDWDDGDAAWSPDGTQIVFGSNRRDDRWKWPGDDIYTLSLKNGKAGELRCLTDGKLGCNAPSWSPDGKSIAFVGAPKVRGAGHTCLYTIAANAENAAPTNISQAFEGSCMDWTNSDIGDEHLAPPPAWSADGKTLYVLASHRGAGRIFAIPVTGASAQPRTLTPGDVHVRDFTVDAACDKIVLLLGTPTSPQEIFVCSTSSSGEMRRITSTNDAFFNQLTLSSLEYMPFKGVDDWDIDGWIIKPPDFDPAKKYPLVVEIHGGPHTQYGYGFFHEMQMLAAEGYVVFYTNPRGSCGYGYDFANAVRGAWGEKDSIDIMMGVDTLVQRGYIDEQRLAVTGGSYGGFMTNWLVGHHNRFKVAITDRCVSNMATMFGTSDIGWDLAEDNLDTTPWEDLDKYMHMSPIKYVQNIQTPLLIIHSEQDLRCNIEQAEQLFAALKWMGREVKFVRFEGQSHGLSRGGHPKMRLERLHHIKDWFAKYLKQ
ncbi:MAG TPA: S9 family peptidase [Ktedonobacteraceae bacterium]|nr:S9 family peptidase [Ktedonobacteraceae bacterium]